MCKKYLNFYKKLRKIIKIIIVYLKINKWLLSKTSDLEPNVSQTLKSVSNII